MKPGKLIFSLLLSLALMASMIPMFALTASAAEPVTCTGFECAEGVSHIKSVKLNGTTVASVDSFSGLVPGTNVTLTVETDDLYQAQSVQTRVSGTDSAIFPLAGEGSTVTGAITIPEGDFTIRINLKAVKEDAKEPTHTVNTNALNVRQGPGTNQPQIGGLTRGTKVTVVETQNGWAKIIYGNGYGWVDSHYLDAISNTDKPNPFQDVFVNDFYYDAVMWAYYAEPQVTTGIDATHFGPVTPVTRGQAVTFLWRSEGCPEPKSTNNHFKDVPSGEYYYKAVLWAEEKGITNGISETEFAPDNTLTTKHIITFLYRTKNPGQDGWKDGAAAKWAADSQGRPFGMDITVNEWTPCPRCGVVVFIHRAGFAG